MNIDTNLAGRLRNTSLSPIHGMLPLFETVSNSIHAIEDAEITMEEGKIVVRVLRDGSAKLPFNEQDVGGRHTENDIVGFEVTDNGIGFDEVNMKSFCTLDSDHKSSRGGRGVGRLLWLKAFEKTNVISIFKDGNNGLCRRTFKFDASRGISEDDIDKVNTESRETTVHLSGFVKKYREKSPKTTETIAKNLLEHCLWYFVRDGGAPNIEIVDGGETVLLHEVYEKHMIADSTHESIKVKEESFDLIHVKLSALPRQDHSIAFCAANRLVKKKSIKGKIPGLFGSFHDDNGDFVYFCYVRSPFFDERVRSERTDFDIAEEASELFADEELSLKDIREAVLSKAKEFLRNYLEANQEQGKKRVSTFVEKKAPRYAPILSRISEEELAIDPDLKDKNLELFLHEKLAKLESEVLSEGHDVMNPRDGERHEEYRKRIKEYLKKAEDIKKSDLANYVTHRRTLLDILEKAIQRQADGHYEIEGVIHDLVMPRGRTSDDIHLDECNLWLVDERLAFHNYLSSDKPLSDMPITKSKEKKKPDIISLNVYDTPVLMSDAQIPPLASIVIVEFKRPMRNDVTSGEQKNPLEQMLNYLERIRNGEVQTKHGRRIPNSSDIPGFCYAICDITPTVEKQCKNFNLTVTSDHSGYFGYNQNHKAYLEVISFDRLVKLAKERNKAFFDKLGLPTT